MENNNKGKRNRILFLGIALLSIFVVQCTKPTAIGGDLVNESETNFWTTDTMPLVVTTVRSTDSLKTYFYASVSKTLARYYLGQLDDPIFGRNTAEIYSQYGPYVGTYSSEFDNATVDSVVLTLVLDSAGFYGDAMAMQSISVFRLDNPMVLDTNYYSYQEFAAEPTPLGELNNFVPNLNKRILQVSKTVNDSNLVYVRIPLDNSLGTEILGLDSLDFIDGKSFAEKFKGIKISATSPSGGMMSINLQHALSEIDIYYQTPTEDSLVFPIHSLRGFAATDYQTKDYSGSFVETHIGVPNDSLFFMQSTGGLNMEIELPDMSGLGNIIVNKAILEFSLEYLNFDDTLLYSPIVQLLLKDSSNHFIQDVNLALSRTGNYSVFGGTLKSVTRNGVSRMIVEMNISAMMQDVVNGTISNILVVKPAPSYSRDSEDNSGTAGREVTGLGRTVIQGFSGAKEWQPKLLLNFTEVN